jgi:hypothetical protein
VARQCEEEKVSLGIYMTSESRLETVDLYRLVGGFYDVRVSSRVFSFVLRWTTLEKVPRVGAVRSWLYLAAKALRVSHARRCLVLSLQ